MESTPKASHDIVARTGEHPLPHRRPDADLIGPISVSCPLGDTSLDYQLRVILISSWSACKRPPAPEAYLICPNCRKAWVAGLWLSSAAYAAEGRAA